MTPRPASVLARRVATEDNEHWMSVSDLMAGLMMVFLFIAVALMRNAMQERDAVKEVAVAYQDTQVAIYEVLTKQFEADLARWNAEIDQDTLEFKFKSPDVLFDTGEISLKPQFKTILEEFFPRYVSVLREYRDSIDEVRIEGHTSSVWNTSTDEDDAYFRNMDLSQGRTRSVLEYAYQLPELIVDRNWVKRHFAAVGFSSSRVVFDSSGNEDKRKSRRVSFRVVTNAETKIRTILDLGPARPANAP